LSSKPFTKSKWFLIAVRVLAVIFVLALTAFIIINRDKAQGLEKFGYPGIFLLSFLTYATVILPVPGLLVVSAMGAVFNPLLVALVAGIGAALGELTGYLAGFGSQPVIERVAIYRRMVEWVKKYGPLPVLFLSALPNPFFDITGAAAGALRMPVLTFFFWTWLGETLKMLFFAYTGGSLKSFFGW
jgi:membrane protein YqaA with SNARE-associated domain